MGGGKRLWALLPASLLSTAVMSLYRDLSPVVSVRDELVRSFYTRVKGQAATCQLQEACTCGLDVSFSDRIQRHVIIRGLADGQICREMMSCFIANRASVATSRFSTRTASNLMAALTWASVCLAMEEPACRDRARQRVGSQHSRSCCTLSGPTGLLAMVYSSHLNRKYSHSAAVPSGRMIGLFTCSSLHGGGRRAGDGRRNGRGMRGQVAVEDGDDEQFPLVLRLKLTTLDGAAGNRHLSLV